MLKLDLFNFMLKLGNKIQINFNMIEKQGLQGVDSSSSLIAAVRK
jgi:hypothetical protein